MRTFNNKLSYMNVSRTITCADLRHKAAHLINICYKYQTQWWIFMAAILSKIVDAHG